MQNTQQISSLSLSKITHMHTRTLNTYLHQMCTSVPCMSHRSTSGDAYFGCYSYAAIDGTRSTKYVQISLWFCLCTLFKEHRNKRSRSYTKFNVRPHIHTHQYTHKRIYRKMQLSTFQACFLLLYWFFLRIFVYARMLGDYIMNLHNSSSSSSSSTTNT